MSLEELKDKLKRIENEENSGSDKKGPNVRFVLYVNITKVASDESDNVDKIRPVGEEDVRKYWFKNVSILW